MHCQNVGCPGEYEQQKILRAFRHRGEPIVIDRIPASVCPVCGDVLLSWETSGAIEALLANPPRVARAVPLYELPPSAEGTMDQFADKAAGATSGAPGGQS